MAEERVRPLDAVKTYRGLRMAMLGAVAVLVASIAIEAFNATCLQGSISAYYYTPVRSIFVGAMFAIGLALIAYKARGWVEDLFLNLSGMFGPVVAVAPTTDFTGTKCPSTVTPTLPMEARSLAPWVAKNINNNFYALLYVGIAGVLIALVIWSRRDRSDPSSKMDRGTLGLIFGVALTIIIGWVLKWQWGRYFNTHAHSWAAGLMFAFLAAAILANAHGQKDTRSHLLTGTYRTFAALMIAGGIIIPAFKLGGGYKVFVVEAWEISFFSVYWLMQTKENWKAEV